MATANDVINIALRRVGSARVRDWANDTSKEAILARDMFHEARKDVLGLHNWNRATRRLKLVELTAAPAFGWDNAFALPQDFIRVVSVHPADAKHAQVPYKLETIENTTTSGSIVVVDYTGLSTETITLQGTNIAKTVLTEGTDWDGETSNTITGDNIVTAIGATSIVGVIGLSASNAAGTVTITSANGYALKNIVLSDAADTTRTQPVVKQQYSLFSDSDTIYLRYIFDADDMNTWSANMRDVLALRLARDFAVPLAQDEEMAAKLENAYQRKLTRIKAIDGSEDWPEQQPLGSWHESRRGSHRGFLVNDG